MSLGYRRGIIIDPEKLEEFEEEHGMVSAAGWYTGFFGGRGIGGYLGYKTSSLLLENPETVQLPPTLELGSYGPEEAVAYSGIAAGYIVGGAATSKGITRAQEYLGIDINEKRPLKWPVEKITGYLSDEKDEIQEAFEYLFEDDED